MLKKILHRKISSKSEGSDEVGSAAEAERTPTIDLIECYFKDHEIAKLHIGCGGNKHSGWLNSDFEPIDDQVLFIDATETFPFQDEQFDFIYSEHVIEHLTYPDGINMLTECYRTLKQNGILRISTPDLSFLMELYRNDKSDLQMSYIKWATDTFIPSAPYYDDIFVINNFYRDWGHKFIYNRKTLESAFQQCGFARITECKINESGEGALRNLENVKRMPDGFLELETMVFEVSKI